MSSTGGGGYGNRLYRDHELVRKDVRDGLITRDVARDVFGVELSEDEDPAVDLDATAALWAELRRVDVPVISPTEAGAGHWAEDNCGRVTSTGKDEARKPMPSPESGIDPVAFSVVMHRLRAIADEMTRVLENTAHGPILALCRDFSCAIHDSQCRQLTMVDGFPIQSTSMHLVLGEIASALEGPRARGDVYVCNSPFHGNTHVGDLVTAAPVFSDDGEHLFWSVVRGHQADTGACIPSSASAVPANVFQEGLQIPPVKLVDAGVLREDVLELYLANMRYPALLHGDLLAQLGAIEKGRIRLEELCRDFASGEVELYIEGLSVPGMTDEEVRRDPAVDQGSGPFPAPTRGAGELEPRLGEDRHQALTERLETTRSIPDLADPKGAVGPEGDVNSISG